MSHRYTVVLTSRARKDLHSVPEKVAHACLNFIYETLSENPRRAGKPLRDSWEGHYAARRQEWRIIYTVDDSRVLIEIVTVNHRSQAYRPR